MVTEETKGIAAQHRKWMKERYREAWNGETLIQPALEKSFLSKAADWAFNVVLLIGVFLAVILAILVSVFFSPIVLVLWPLWAGWEEASKYGYYKGEGNFGLKDVFAESFRR